VIGNNAYLHHNIAFNGLFTPVLAKAQKSCNLIDALALGVDPCSRRNYRERGDPIRRVNAFVIRLMSGALDCVLCYSYFGFRNSFNSSRQAAQFRTCSRMESEQRGAAASASVVNAGRPGQPTRSTLRCSSCTRRPNAEIKSLSSSSRLTISPSRDCFSTLGLDCDQS
jgi:hypothetical protein